MSFTAKILNNGLRLLQDISVARNFHMFLKPLGAGTGSAESSAIATNTSFALNQLKSNNCMQKMLTPFSVLITQVAGFKIKGRLKRRCKDCYIVVREERAYIICPTHPRHKQMAMKKRDYKSWILTHATQSKVRPY